VNQKAVEARKRLLTDFEFWASRCAFIRTKEAKIVPLKLNRGQRKLLECCTEQLEQRGYIRLIILKGRQMGSSTYVEAFLYWWVSQREAQKAVVVAHDKPATANIFTMTQRLHNRMPEAVKPSTARSSTTELVFDKLDSAYRIATAGGDGIVRSDTITAAHLSEAAWWPANSAVANYSGLMDTMPSGKVARGTIAFEESTANGFNWFWEHCDAARKGESDWRFVFLPWFWMDEYTADVPADFERLPDEVDLDSAVFAEFGEHLSDGQLMFRRLKVAEKGRDLFRQEFPCTADEAFLTSGRPVFNPDRVVEMQKKRKEPLALKALVGNGDGGLEWEDHPQGELKCFLPHDPNETYYVGGDVGGGVRKDASVAQVLDSKRRQAAVWRSDRYLPDYFGIVLAHLARFYNDARICCERNNHGILTNRVIHVDEGYTNVYQETAYDKVTDTETEHVGFLTSEKTKPMVVDKLRGEVRDRTCEVYDDVTLDEMKQFIINEKGKMEAEKGHHDDCVIALALANHINEGAWAPIVNKSDWYVSVQ
jgi:hypothetical protein